METDGEEEEKKDREPGDADNDDNIQSKTPRIVQE